MVFLLGVGATFLFSSPSSFSSSSSFPPPLPSLPPLLLLVSFDFWERFWPQTHYKVGDGFGPNLPTFSSPVLLLQAFPTTPSSCGAGDQTQGSNKWGQHPDNWTRTPALFCLFWGRTSHCSLGWLNLKFLLRVLSLCPSFYYHKRNFVSTKRIVQGILVPSWASFHTKCI